MLCQFPSANLSALLQMGMLPRQRLTRLAIRDGLGEASKGQSHYIHKYMHEHKGQTKRHVAPQTLTPIHNTHQTTHPSLSILHHITHAHMCA